MIIDGVSDNASAASRAARHVHAHPDLPSEARAALGEATIRAALVTAFFASIRFEEGHRTTFALTIFSGADPLHAPEPGVIPPWSLHRFDSDLPYDVAIVARLARALDPEQSSIAVRVSDDGVLEVIGIVDTGALQAASSHGLTSARPAPPGTLHIHAIAPGHLTLKLGVCQIAELRDGQVTTDLPDITNEGPVRDRLASLGLADVAASVRERVGPELEGHVARVMKHRIETVWLSIPSRVLEHMRGFGVGGALIYDDRPPAPDELRAYPLRYATVRDGVEALAIALVGLEGAAAGATSGARWEGRARDAAVVLDSAISFIAHLTRLDGVTLLGPGHEVFGVGGTILHLADPPTRLALDASGTETAAHDPRTYGTRHRSVMSYCYRHPGALGFIVSQDGDVRAALRTGAELGFWDGFSTDVTA